MFSFSIWLEGFVGVLEGGVMGGDGGVGGGGENKRCLFLLLKKCNLRSV